MTVTIIRLQSETDGLRLNELCFTEFRARFDANTTAYLILEYHPNPEITQVLTRFDPIQMAETNEFAGRNEEVAALISDQITEEQVIADGWYDEE